MPNPFYNTKKVVGCDPISLGVKLMVSLKHLALFPDGIHCITKSSGGTSNILHYFQMGSTTSQRAVEELCHTISINDSL